VNGQDNASSPDPDDHFFVVALLGGVFQKIGPGDRPFLVSDEVFQTIIVAGGGLHLSRIVIDGVAVNAGDFIGIEPRLAVFLKPIDQNISGFDSIKLLFGYGVDAAG
jgi:hypothetical protein